MKYATAGDVMTSPVLTVPEDATLEQLAGFFMSNSVTGVPVTSTDGAVVGVVSVTDIVRHDSIPVGHGDSRGTHEYYLATRAGPAAAEEFSGLRINADENVSVGDLMTPMVFAVNEDVPVQEVADMMIRGSIHRVLVMQDKRLIGIVTAMDLLKVVRDL